MCHSSSDVLAGHRQSRPSSRPRQSPPSSFCEWQSRAESPTRVLRQVPSPSPPGSSRRPRQSRPEALLESQQIRPRQSLCMESPLESSNKPRQARPVSVRVTRQALQGRPPSQSRPPSSAVHAKVVRCPCQSPAKSADRPVGRQGLFARQSSTVAARLALRAPCQSCPPSPLVPAKLFLGCPVLVKPQSSAVPARVVCRPRQSRPPSSC